MRVLVTGGSGYLATEVVAQLAARGHTLRLADVREVKTDHEFVRCDVLDIGQLLAALTDADVVFHAVVGGGEPSDDSPQERVGADSRHFQLTVMGTFNLLQAARATGVPKVVIVTSEAARGQRIPITGVEVCDETTPAKPDYVYALGKYVQEIIAEYAARIDRVRTICLRNGSFGRPEGKDFQWLASGLLYQRAVTRRDLARAAVLAIEDTEMTHEVFLLNNRTEFTRADLPLLRTTPEQVIEKYYPEAVALLAEYGFNLEAVNKGRNLWKLDDTSKAERLLGWRTTYTFRDFYEALKAGRYRKGQVFVERTTSPTDPEPIGTYDPYL